MLLNRILISKSHGFNTYSIIDFYPSMLISQITFFVYVFKINLIELPRINFIPS